MSNTNEATARQQFALTCARNRVTDPAEVEALVQKIIESAPPAVLDTLADLSDIEKANKLSEMYFASKNGGKGTDPTQSKPTNPSETNITTEETAAIQNYLDGHAESTGKRQARTRVVAVLTDKPVLAKIHTGAKLIPNITEKTEEVFSKYEAKLVDDPANIKEFKELKAAFMKKEPMEVYINPDAREKNIGWRIETLDDQGNPTTMTLSKESAVAFLLVKVQGVIQPHGENSVGIRIKWTAKRQAVSSDNEAAATNKGTTSVTLLNRKALSENPNLTICTCVMLETSGQKVINDQYNAKTARSFKILTDRMNSKGEVIKRTVRMPGKTSVYRVTRLEEYVPTFGQAERSKGTGMTKTEKKKVSEAIVRSLYTLQMDPTVENDELRTALAEIRRSKGTTQPTNFS